MANSASNLLTSSLVTSSFSSVLPASLAAASVTASSLRAPKSGGGVLITSTMTLGYGDLRASSRLFLYSWRFTSTCSSCLSDASFSSGVGIPYLGWRWAQLMDTLYYLRGGA